MRGLSPGDSGTERVPQARAGSRPSRRTNSSPKAGRRRAIMPDIVTAINVQAIFEAVLVLFMLFLVLRVSLARRREELRLRGGLLTLNLLTGALAGCALGLLVQDVVRARGGGPSAVADYQTLAAAALRVLPLLGLMAGALLGHRLFGALWRRFLLRGPA